MSYIFPAGYSGPFHDYYTYGDFDDPRGKAFIEAINPNTPVAGVADLSGVFLKPRRFNNHGFKGAGNETYITTEGGTGNYNSITSWNCGYKSMFLITPEHVLSTAHGKQRNGSDRGFGVGVLQFMERSGATFNVNIANGGLTFGASYLDYRDEGGTADTVVFKLSEPITGKDVLYNTKFYDGNRNTLSDGSADTFSLKSQNTLTFIQGDKYPQPAIEILDEYTSGVPKQRLFSCDSGSTTFVLHKDEGTLLTATQANGVYINEENIGRLNQYLVSEGHAGVTLVYDDQLTDNWYTYFGLRGDALGSTETITVPGYANGRTLKVEIVGTDRDGRQTKPIIKTIQVKKEGFPPPNFIRGSEALISTDPESNSFYCQSSTDGFTIDLTLQGGSVFLGYTMDNNPAGSSYENFGVTCTSEIQINVGSTLNDSDLTTFVNGLNSTSADSDSNFRIRGGGAFSDFVGSAFSIPFGNSYAGQTVYGRPSITNVLGTTLGDWYEIGRAITAGHGPTFTSFSFDVYGATAGSTMIGTAAGYTALPDNQLNSVSFGFGLGGLDTGDIFVNNIPYPDTGGFTFSGPTFAFRIPTDCPVGASLAIIDAGIFYKNVYNRVDVLFDGSLSGITYIAVGGS
tara:strand:- start:2107 stop:3984 length:1878 start_codon:yes stop_codon:yes gene_type:complete